MKSGLSTGGNDLDKPKLRQLNAFQIETGGKQYICLNDPLKITDRELLVDYQTYFIIALMDGEHEISDIQLAYTRKFGDLLLDNRMDSLLNELDKNLFLENERFEKAKHRLYESFRKQPVRLAEHAGLAYRKNPEKLRVRLNEIMKMAGEGERNHKNRDKYLRGLIAPHIDIQVGAEGYAHAYQRIAQSEAADLYIILGVSHVETYCEFVLTEKDFETPLGVSKTEKSFVKNLAKSLTLDYMEDEFVHKSEHSIEFQVLFLQHLLHEKEYRIVPILCSVFRKQLEKNALPETDDDVGEFLTALQEQIVNYDGKVCIIAGVDLSHVGQKFGTSGPLGPSQLAAIENLDREMLRLIEDGDIAGFYRHIETDKNGRNVCGFAAIYSLLFLLKDSRAELLYYGQNHEPATSSVVSFASMAFY